MMEGFEGHRVKVFFPLPVVDDWPPVSVESMWAEPLGEDVYRVDNIPLFKEEVSLEDTIRATRNSDGVLEFCEVIDRGGHRNVQVYCFETGVTGEVIDFLIGNGCGYEGSPYEDIGLFSVDVPPSARWEELQAYLDGKEGEGEIEWALLSG